VLRCQGVLKLCPKCFSLMLAHDAPGAIQLEHHHAMPGGDEAAPTKTDADLLNAAVVVNGKADVVRKDHLDEVIVALVAHHHELSPTGQPLLW